MRNLLLMGFLLALAGTVWAQEEIFVRNLRFLRPGGTGFLIVKARSADVAARPDDVYKAAQARLARAGVDVREVRTLDPHAADHAALVVGTR